MDGFTRGHMSVILPLPSSASVTASTGCRWHYRMLMCRMPDLTGFLVEKTLRSFPQSDSGVSFRCWKVISRTPAGSRVLSRMWTSGRFDCRVTEVLLSASPFRPPLRRAHFTCDGVPIQRRSVFSFPEKEDPELGPRGLRAKASL